MVSHLENKFIPALYTLPIAFTSGIENPVISIVNT